MYETDGGQSHLVQAHAEHAASFLEKPPRSGAHHDVTGLADHRLAASVGETRFLFTRLRHHELAFDSLTLAMEFYLALHASLTSRARKTALDELRAYVQARLEAHDLEWWGFRDDPETSREWKRLCAPRPPIG
ncbi:MAG: hypothetical protein Q8S73_24500 [Deltaproteobacteria bacterium]|nr:hypothetical protein [Deltaproteobacteria bacterium]